MNVVYSRVAYPAGSPDRISRARSCSAVPALLIAADLVLAAAPGLVGGIQSVPRSGGCIMAFTQGLLAISLPIPPREAARHRLRPLQPRHRRWRC